MEQKTIREHTYRLLNENKRRDRQRVLSVWEKMNVLRMILGTNRRNR